MLHKYPLSGRFLLFLVLPMIFLIGYFHNQYVVDALPQTDGEIVVNGIYGDVSVLRDEHGVAQISAGTDHDVYFAMGYLHAQDRLWQLELQKRISQGRLSEIFGDSTLRQDIWIRTLGIHKSAEKAKYSLTAEALLSLEAYASGVNAWLDTNKKLPIEFLILDVTPEPWTPVDSLAWIKMFALDLAGNYQDELQRYLATQYIDHEELVRLFPKLSKQLSSVSMEIEKNLNPGFLKSFQFLQNDVNAQFGTQRRIKGSNAWVISGAFTDNGKPILANDPHLGLQIPSLWYAVGQSGERLNSVGMSLVGLPTVIFGKNNDVAWGGTNMMADAQDLYIEQTDVLNPNRYKHDGHWKEFQTHTEEIYVKAKFPAQLRSKRAPVEIRIRKSVHGPIISDVLRDLDVHVALQWTALTDKDASYESFYQVNYATDWQSFKQAFDGYVAPAMNILYADNENNIGFVGIGEIPLRGTGSGVLPLAGGQRANDWQGFIPFSEMPEEFNPEKGYLVSANNKNVPQDYPYFISSDWALPARARRIAQLIEKALGRDLLVDINHSKMIHADRKDLSAGHLQELLTISNSATTQQREALQALRDWDGVASEESVGATIYYNWQRHLRDQLFSDEFHKQWNKHGRDSISSLLNTIDSDAIANIVRDESVWCDDLASVSAESCEDILQASFESMISELTKLSGNNVANWKWGGMHHAVYEHAPFSGVKLLDTYFERKIRSGGATNVVNVSGGFFNESKGYTQNFGAGFRQIIQFDDDSPRHVYMNSTGQSGQAASDHYDDMLEAFADVAYFSFNEKDSGYRNLVLKPAAHVGAAK